MGTRGILGVRIDGEDKLTYNHFDSYPEALGAAVVEAVRHLKRGGWDKVKEQARAIRLVTDKTPVTAEDIEKFGGKMNLEVGSQSPTDWYCLLRDAQGDLLSYLKLGVMEDSHDFILDSLFCEWGYIVNLDTMKLEVYRGFQKVAHTKGRYSKIRHPDRRPDSYFPCALVVEFDLEKIPKNFVAVVAKAVGPDDADAA